jgi:hypothetical protein
VVVLISFSYYLWCVGGALGYLGGKLGGGKKTGVRGRIKSVIFSVNRYQFHLHHWFVAIIALVVCLVKGFYIGTPHLFYGSMCGLAIQGILSYDDWFRLIKKKIRHESDEIEIAVDEETEEATPA